MKNILILNLICCFLNIKANEFYVSNSGLDSNPGSISSPFKTIQHAASIMQPGDICFIRGGIYRETIHPFNSGTTSSPIQFSGYQNENVIVTGLDTVTNWSIYNNNIYNAPIKDSVFQVFINGILINWARYPNKITNNLDLTDMADVVINANNTGTIGNKSFSTNFFKDGIIVALCGTKWVSVMGKITSSENNTFAATNTSNFWSQGISPEIYLGNGKGYITGLLSLLDAENEWHYQLGKLYVCTPGKKDPKNMIVEARTRQIAFDFHDLSYIELKGIQIKAATINMHSSKNCIVDSCIVRYPTSFFKFTDEFNRDSRNPENWTGYGIIMSGSNNIIKNSYIAHSWGDGVSVWGDNNKVENCIIEDCNWMALDCAPITVSGKNNEITNNTLSQTARSGVVHRYLQNGVIKFNDISLCGILCTDLGVTYAFDTDGKGTEISYNWMHDNLSKGFSAGIYLDNGDTNFLVHHNVVWNCKEGIKLNTPSVNIQIYNNTLWNILSAMSVGEANGIKMQNVITWNNFSNKDNFNGTDIKNNLTTTRGGFVDSANHNYSLTASSPAIDYGNIIPEITDSFSGNAPDAGAYEYGKPFWKPGANIVIPTFNEDVPTLPFNLAANAIALKKVFLLWKDNSINEEGFRIERKNYDSSTFERIANVPANSTSYYDTSTLPSTSYLYRVCGYNKAGFSIYSNEAIITTNSDCKTIRIEAENYSEMSGIIVNGYTIGNCDNNDWEYFSDITFCDTLNKFTAMLAVPIEYAGQELDIRVDSINGILLGTLITKSTGGWDNYQKQSCSIKPIFGKHTIYIIFKGSSGIGNFDWYRFDTDTLITNSIKNVNGNIDKCLLSQNYPNPFHEYTAIDVKLDKYYPDAYIRISTLQGIEIKRIKIGMGGENKVSITNENLETGVYFYSLIINNGIWVSKMMIHL